MNTITLEFDKDDLKYIRARHYDGSTSELNKYCTALKLQIRRAAPRYWYNAYDLERMCELDKFTPVLCVMDFVYGITNTTLINRAKIRYDMVTIAQDMIMNGEY